VDQHESRGAALKTKTPLSPAAGSLALLSGIQTNALPVASLNQHSYGSPAPERKAIRTMFHEKQIRTSLHFNPAFEYYNANTLNLLLTN
jgi:hypothetical protein